MDYIKAFLIGGLICAAVQILLDRTKLMPGRVMVLLVCTGAVLGFIGAYEPFVKFAGAGASVPLLGFGNVLWKGVKEAVDKNGFLGKCDASIASSTKAKEKLLKWGINPNKIFISLLTVDVNKICTIEHKPEQGRLLYVGSMIERKGLDLLVSALRYVDENFQLRIVGNGTDKEIEELRTRIKNANIEDNIIFCGYKEGQELLEEYQKAQIFVLPTREDCFGLVLLEALCAEVPIISSKYADGAYDVIDEGKNGILVDPYDSKEFGDTINKVLKKEISLDGKKDIIVDKFTFDEVSKGYINAIDYVLKGER